MNQDNTKQRGVTAVSPGEGPTPRLRLAGPSGSRRLLPGWGCKVFWPLSLSYPHGKPTGTTSPPAPCAPGAPAAQRCWWESRKPEFSFGKLEGGVCRSNRVLICEVNFITLQTSRDVQRSPHTSLAKTVFLG